MLVKLPPVIVRPEELVKNDMHWWLVICNLKGNLKKEPYYVEQVRLHVPVLEAVHEREFTQALVFRSSES